MFGGKNRISSEEYEQMKDQLDANYEYFQKIASAQSVFSENVTEMQQSREQLREEIRQAGENASAVSSYAGNNSRETADIVRKLDSWKKDMEKARIEYEQMRECMLTQSARSMEIVEGNKHFTTPSKSLSEAPCIFYERNRECQEELVKMLKNSKQMTVLSLNAAIEASRMGGIGLQFVEAAEEVRILAGTFESAIQTIRAHMEESEKQMNEMEEQIRHLVSMIKDSNIAAAKFMKQCAQDVKTTEQSVAPDFSKELETIRGQIIGIRNTEDEIVKSEERNRMRLADMLEELHSQEEDAQDIVSELEPLFAAAKRITGQ